MRGLKGPREDFDKGRLAGAVVADEANDIPGIEIKRYVLERVDASECLLDPSDAYERRLRSPCLRHSRVPSVTSPDAAQRNGHDKQQASEKKLGEDGSADHGEPVVSNSDRQYADQCA